MSRIYEIEFMQYTNSMKDTVEIYDKDRKYYSLPKKHEGKILIEEKDIYKWQSYGYGIKTMRYIGELHIPK